MASPQKENGHTPIANELLEALARLQVSGTEHQILFFIMRRTYGWHKKNEKLSINTITEAIGRKRRMVIYALQSLEARKVIFIERKKIETGLNEVSNIGINKDYEKWGGSARNCTTPKPKKVVQNNALGVVQEIAPPTGKGVVQEIALGVVQNVAPNKRNNINKVIKKDIKEKQSAASDAEIKPITVASIIDAFKDVNPSHERLFANKTQRAAVERLMNKHGPDRILQVVLSLIRTNGLEYAPVITTPLQLESKLGQLAAFHKKHLTAESKKGLRNYD